VEVLDESDPQRWVLWGRVAVLGDPGLFLTYFSGVVEKFKFGYGNADVVFQIGKALSGHVSVEKRTIFGWGNDFDNRIGPANSAVSFYKSQLAVCRLAVDAWSLCCLRLNVNKDFRVFMGKIIWESRDLALFYVSNKDPETAPSSPVQKKARN
jgi:hypothetical protein